MGALRERLQEYWDDLDAGKRRWIVLVGSSVAGITLLYLAMYAAGETGASTPQFKEPQEETRSLLTSSRAKDMSLSALSAEMEQLRQSRRTLKSEVSRLARELERSSKQEESGDGSSSSSAARSGPDEVTQRKLNALKAQIETLRQAIQSKANNSGSDHITIDTIGGGESGRSERSGTQMANRRRPSLFEHEQSQGDRPPAQPASPSNAPGGRSQGGADDGEGAQKTPTPRTRVSVFAQGADGTTSTLASMKRAPDAEDEASERDQGVYIPAGSMISGTLLTGLDAPTGSQARQEPVPVLLRVKHEAILPNRYRADVRECFMVASGYGSISSSRVKLRSETLSCIREDGGVVEAGIGAWAVSGKDGKEGIEGRLVSRQGEVLGRSMLAGFASGFSQLFGQQQVPQLNTNPNSGSPLPYQSVFSERAAQAATVQGAGQALDRLAQFYIDMAEEMFPVIEVNAGRRVTFVVNQGTRLKIK